MRAVNLLPPDAYTPKPKLPYAKVVLAATAPALAGALVYLGYSLEHSKVSDKQIALGVIQSQIAARAPSQAEIAAVSHVADEKTKHQLELADALSKQMPWDVAFEQIARVLPARAWLTTLQATSPTPAASVSSGVAPCTITGYALTQADVANVLARLQLVPALSQVQLTSTIASKLGTKNVVQFTLTAQIARASS